MPPHLVEEVLTIGSRGLSRCDCDGIIHAKARRYPPANHLSCVVLPQTFRRAVVVLQGSRRATGGTHGMLGCSEVGGGDFCHRSRNKAPGLHMIVRGCEQSLNSTDFSVDDVFRTQIPGHSHLLWLLTFLFTLNARSLEYHHVILQNCHVRLKCATLLCRSFWPLVLSIHFQVVWDETGWEWVEWGWGWRKVP